MANLIKQPVARTTRTQASPLDDLTRRAERLLEAARDEAQAVRVAAQCEAENEQARQAEDWQRRAEAELDERVSQEVDRRLAGLVPTLRDAGQKLAQAEQELQGGAEATCLRVALAIAERIIRRELRQSHDIPLALVREALELAGGSSRVRLKLHPADEVALRPHLAALSRADRPIEVVADPAVTAGGCRVETAQGVIDQQIETQLRRVFEELSG